MITNIVTSRPQINNHYTKSEIKMEKECFKLEYFAQKLETKHLTYL